MTGVSRYNDKIIIILSSLHLLPSLIIKQRTWNIDDIQMISTAYTNVASSEVENMFIFHVWRGPLAVKY